MKTLYRFRGEILGAFALALWMFPPGNGRVPLSVFPLMFLGIFLRVDARRLIGEHSRGSEKAAPKLVTCGIYSRIRHPLYASNLCFCLAFILFHLRFGWVSLGFFALVFLFVFALAKSEEKFLEKKFGESFLTWKSCTAMFVPGRRHFDGEKVLKAERRPVARAFVADRWTWFWILFYTFLLVARRSVDLPLGL